VRARIVAIAVIAVVLVGAAALFLRGESVPPFSEQICGLEDDYLTLIRRGYDPERSGEVSVLPRPPGYVASGRGGYTHSGPYRYLQHVPLVFYGPGVVPQGRSSTRPVTIADVAPTLATLLKGSFRTEDGEPLTEVARFTGSLLRGERPRLIVAVVWDGGGWNVLEQWPEAWPNLRAAIDGGVSFENAIVGSSPSVTPAVHTTLGTGTFPYRHGITNIHVRDEDGKVVDAFYRGESSRLIRVPTLAERWDELNDNRALVGMIGYEPWHLGMIGQGAERSGGDKDDAAWLNVKTNEWITNPDYYSLPASFVETPGLDEDLHRLDAADGSVDDTWLGHGILNDPARIEETPAFIAYHGRAMRRLIAKEPYGDDAITDFLFTNFKQIDRLGHYFSMHSDEVRASVEATDEELGRLFEFLNAEVGRGKWVTVITADHGQQPDERMIDGYGIDPAEFDRDLEAEFGDVLEVSWPTELFLDSAAMKREDVKLDDIARFAAGYRLRDNAFSFADRVVGVRSLDAGDRLFDMAVPAPMLTEEVACPAG
jgi:arylsulfatase A-like enzyme